jgi:hypothetical protein
VRSWDSNCPVPGEVWGGETGRHHSHLDSRLAVLGFELRVEQQSRSLNLRRVLSRQGDKAGRQSDGGIRATQAKRLTTGQGEGFVCGAPLTSWTHSAHSAFLINQKISQSTQHKGHDRSRSYVPSLIRAPRVKGKWASLNKNDESDSRQESDCQQQRVLSLTPAPIAVFASTH